MTDQRNQTPHDLDALALLEETLSTTAQLAEKQIKLLRAEMKTVIEEERNRVVFISIGVASSIAGLAVLLVAAALALGGLVGHPALWTLGFGVVVIALGGSLLAAGLRRLKPKPLENTRNIVQEEIAWAKDKLEETTTKMSSPSSETSKDSVVVESR